MYYVSLTGLRICNFIAMLPAMFKQNGKTAWCNSYKLKHFKYNTKQ